jgi:hypothetical protein
VHALLFSPTHATFLAHVIVLDLIITITITSVEQYKLWSTLIWIFLQPPIISTALSQNIILSTLFSNIFSRCSSLYVGDPFSYSELLGFLICPSTGILETRRYNFSEIASVSVFRWGGGVDPVSETLCLVEYQTMDEVQKPSNSWCDTPSSELFSIYKVSYPYKIKANLYYLYIFLVFTISGFGWGDKSLSQRPTKLWKQ